MGHIKNILIECGNDPAKVEQRIKEIAKQEEVRRSNFADQAEKAMQDPRKRSSLAKHLGIIINLIIKK